MKTRFIFITGGVVSSLGKGLASASLGATLQARGYSVRLRKLDPYLNVDPGTMSPIQHGEVFVTDDGAETDLDLGHYERFTDVTARKGDNVTAGQIYQDLITKERRGDYLGGTVQVIPHVTDLIKNFILKDTEDTDFLLCEIGGTVGDIEALPFFESIRQLGYELGSSRAIFMHLTLLPYLGAANELKTKPTQHSVKELRSIGIQPDLLLCRAEQAIPQKEIEKIALFSNLPKERVIPALNVASIYEVPVAYHEAGLDTQVLKLFRLSSEEKPRMTKWKKLIEQDLTPKQEVTIAIVGKYTGLKDAYKSLIESLHHAGMANSCKVHLRWINARTFLQNDSANELKDVHGILVPGGFGQDGVRGKIEAARFARENKVPYFGICLGMQLAVIECARNLANISDANSTEFAPSTKHPVVGLMTEWMQGEALQTRAQNGDLGGTMRLGSYDCTTKVSTLARTIYDRAHIQERHRHRYEVNINYMEQLQNAGLVFSGMSPDGNLPEMIEYADHPWFLGVQFHPEFKSRPFSPHPVLKSFVAAVMKHARGK